MQGDKVLMGGQVQGDKVLMGGTHEGGLMRGDIDLLGGGKPNFDILYHKLKVLLLHDALCRLRFY